MRVTWVAAIAGGNGVPSAWHPATGPAVFYSPHVTADVTPQRASTRPSLARRCSRMACKSHAVATLTYVYSDSTAVVGPLATYAEPHTYDLCTDHAERLTPPRGWDIVRLTLDGDSTLPTPPMTMRLGDDLSALADAVREDPATVASRPAPVPAPAPLPVPGDPAAWQAGASRGHLRAVRFDG